MDPRPVANASSLNATLALLRNIITNPDKYRHDDELLDALKTQSRLARYQNPGAGIKGMSLNTFKAIANSDAPGGFSQFDSLRRQALEKLTQFQADTGLSDNTQASKKRKLKRLDSDVDVLKAANLVLLRAVGKALADLMDIADTKAESVRKRLAAEAEARIHASLSVNAPPYDNVNASGISVTRMPP